MSKTIYIGGRLESKEKGNVVTGANAILDDTKGKKQNVINKETDDELARLEQSKQDNLTFDNAPTEDSTNPVTSGGVYTAEKALSDAIEAILLLIPSAATALNKLVDTNTMNSSISTATATFRGTYNAVSDLGLTYQATHAQIEAALDALGLTADNNDYAFVQVPVSDQSQDIAKTERYKKNGTNWLYEYDLNTSGFTAAQWAAINSGITVALVTKLTDLPTAAALQLAFNAKQDTLTFDNEPTALSQNPVTSGGIYTAIQAVATALYDYSTTTDGRLNVLEGLVPSEASSSNKLTDKAYVDGLIQAITELIPAEATSTNQLADKAYVLAQILAATPAFKGQFTTLAELQAVASPKAGDLGIVRTKDSDGMDVFTVYQYLNNAWNVFYSLSYHPQTKPATTGTTGDYPYNGMGRVELAMNMVNTGTELAPVMVNQLTQDMFYKGAVGSRVPNTNTIFVIRYDYVLAENITIPDGCVLEFEGGSISGSYTLTGTNTGIKAGLVKIFDTATTLAGTWNVAEVYPEWFGAVGDGVTNDSNVINEMVKKLYDNVTIKFQSGKTYIANINVFRSNITFIGYGAKIKGVPGAAGNVFVLGYPDYDGRGYNPDIDPSDTSWKAFDNVNMYGLDIDGDYTHTLFDSNSDLVGHGVFLTLIRRSVFRDLRIHDCHLSCFYHCGATHNFNTVDIVVENGGNSTVLGGAHYMNFDSGSSYNNYFKVISKGGYSAFRLDSNSRHNICDVVSYGRGIIISSGGPGSLNTCSNNIVRAVVLGNNEAAHALVMTNSLTPGSIRDNKIELTCEGITEEAAYLGCENNQISITSKDCYWGIVKLENGGGNQIKVNSYDDGNNLDSPTRPLLDINGSNNNISVNIKNYGGSRLVTGGGSNNIITCVSDNMYGNSMSGIGNVVKIKTGAAPLLWTNSDITQNVGNDTDIDLSAGTMGAGYDALRIEFIVSNTSSYAKRVFLYTTIDFSRTDSIGFVRFTEVDNQIVKTVTRNLELLKLNDYYKLRVKECVIASSNSSSTTVDNSYLIPTRIWGVYYD